MTLTNDEVRDRYIAAFGAHAWDNDERWASDALCATRLALEAPDIGRAVEVLVQHGWGDPVDCAMRLRGEKNKPKCPHCGGTGLLEA